MDLYPTLTRTRAAALGAVFLLAAVAGCSQDDSSSSADTTTTAADNANPSSDEYVIVAADFSLTDLTVEAGEAFTLDNQGDATHTATADDGSFDSGRVDAGQRSAPMTAPSTPGEYTFHCEIHNSMTGTLTVK